jgi:hypothetical protein
MSGNHGQSPSTLFPVEKEVYTILIFFLLTTAFITGVFNLFRATTRAYSIRSKSNILMALAAGTWMIKLSLSYVWSISDWMLVRNEVYPAVVRFCSVGMSSITLFNSIVTLRVGSASVISLLYSLSLLGTFRRLHAIAVYPVYLELFLMVLSCLVFGTETLIVVPYVRASPF